MRGSNMQSNNIISKQTSKNGRGIPNVNGFFKSDGDCCNAWLLKLDV